MKRSKLLGMAFMVILALSSITAATASAETLPNVLPLGTVAEPITFTSSSTGAAFGSAGLTEVTSETSSGESTSEGTEGNAGTFHETYKGVKNGLLGTCTGTGDSSGIVLVLGKYEDKDADLAGKLIVAVLFLLSSASPVQFLCGTTPITVAGCVAGELTPLNTTALLLTVSLIRPKGSNDNEITSYLSTTGLPEFCLLSAKIGAGATELSAQNQTVDLTGFKLGTTVLSSVLVMPM
jgi:hypothetical protein